MKSDLPNGFETISLQEGRHWIGRVIMCVDLNAFYPSCEELRDPTLKGKPHAVIMTDQKEGITKGAVSSCSYEARKHGVRSAMSLSKAKSLCPDLILRPVDIRYYSKLSQQVVNILTEFADVLEQASIDEAFLDCTLKVGSDKPEAYGKKIKQSVRDRCGLLCSVGVTSTKATAKIASDYLKPDGLTVVYPDSLAAFLELLEVSRVAGIGPKTQEALKEMRIETLGHLATADVQKLIEQFGKNGYWMWNVANGTEDELVVPREDHVSLSTEYTLDNFTRDKTKVVNFLYDLVDEIYQRAKRQEYLFKTVGVKIARTDFSIESRETSFESFQCSREIISSVIEKLVDKFALTYDKPAIGKLGLKISHLIEEKEMHRKYAVQKTLLDYI
jgi:DNA polymerase IV (DinB-like DNA polymerase)